jgi:hypothetical protein
MHQEHHQQSQYHSALNTITERRIFKVLDGLKRTAAGLDNIPAWFLKIAFCRTDRQGCAWGLTGRDRGIRWRDRGVRQPVRGKTEAFKLLAEARRSRVRGVDWVVSPEISSGIIPEISGKIALLFRNFSADDTFGSLFHRKITRNVKFPIFHFSNRITWLTF